MRILVVSQYYSPDMTAAAFRIRETVDLLKGADHDVHVITAQPHKYRVEVDQAADEREGVYRVHVPSIASGGMRNYLNHYLRFVSGSLWTGVKQRFGSWKPDVIWTSSPPLFAGITGRMLAGLYGCPLVLDIRDIWPLSAVAAEQISMGGKAYKLGRVLERWLYNGADHITCVSRPMAQYIASELKTPATVIYNGVLSDAVEASCSATEIKKRILYAGNLGRVQGLGVLIDAFADIVRDGSMPGWRLEFIGGGVLEKDLINLIAERGIGNRVTLAPPIGKEDVFRELACSAALVINLKADKVFDLTIPSKVFDYMVAGRPILYGISGEGAELLGSTGANVAFEGSNRASFISALQTLDANYDKLQTAAVSNPLAVRGIYSRNRNTEKLVEIFEQILGGRHEHSRYGRKWFRRHKSYCGPTGSESWREEL